MDPFVIDITLARRSFDVCVALNLGAAETVALVGPSGAGKTSLLRAVAGLERPRAGRVALGDEVWLDVAEGLDLSPERRRVGYLPQDYGLFPHLTVAGNVRFAARRNRPDLLERLGVAHLATARPSQLSGGERQRVALARALAREPRVLLLDEPFGALDAITRRQVRDELAEILAALGLPALLVTHAFDDATAVADRIAVIDGGRIVQLGSAGELWRRPVTAMVAALTGANVLDAVAAPSATGSIVRLAGGGELRSTTRADGPVQIAVHPWALELSDPHSSPVTDTVLSIRPDRGALEVRLTRFIVHTVPASNGRTQLAEGSIVGLRALPADVRVLPPSPSGASNESR